MIANTNRHALKYAVVITHIYVQSALTNMNPYHHHQKDRVLNNNTHYSFFLLLTFYMISLQHLMHTIVIVASSAKQKQNLSQYFFYLRVCWCIAFRSVLCCHSNSCRAPSFNYSLLDLFWGERFDLHIISLLRCNVLLVYANLIFALLVCQSNKNRRGALNHYIITQP